MSTSAFEVSFDKISKLVATFQESESRYLSPNYQEAEVRKDFIDKFFIALGWDVNHDEQTNPYEQEVKVEPSVSASGQRRADYAFHLTPNFRTVRFFVEAKKPHGDIATPDNYFQTIRYAWSSETPLAVVTDFKEFHVLDCRYMPDIATALNRHIARYHYSEYTDRNKFAEIYWLFSREAVASGSLEKRAKELPKPRGKNIQQVLFPGSYQSIDESFLKKLDEYRTALARAFKNRNPEFDGETLTELVQRTLDRLVFIRFLEDKGIESQRIVEHFGDRGTPWEDFVATSRRLDSIYNGIVFKRHTLLDGVSFHPDETVFADICESISNVNSPYDFDAIPIHILGSIYERFLGNVIVTTAKRADVKPKPEVRKAGGVYYTPEYIVRYIVENTIGKLIQGKTPDQVAEMRFADIACGSGSFLLGIFDQLLAYHGHYYNENPKKARKGDCNTHDGKLYLSLNKKREILLNNIYGVDIDPQAVEVCQLSLYLRLLKDETTGSTHQHLLEFAHVAKMKKLLPDLSKNVVCGNSLIGTEILDGQLFVPEEDRRLTPMDFVDAFPEVMTHGGFDVLVGNPPYRRELNFKYLMDEIARTEFGQKYRVPRMDLWYYFVHRGLDLLKPSGKLSFIVNAYWTAGTGAQKLISALSDTAHIDEIFSLGKLKVFKGVSGQHMILRVTKGKSKSSTTVKLADSGSEIDAEPFVIGNAHVVVIDKTWSQLFCNNKIDLQPQSEGLMAKLDRETPLSKLGNVRQGIAENPASINRKTNIKYRNRFNVGEGVFTLQPQELKRLKLPVREQALLRPYHDLQDIGRYRLSDPSLTLIYSTTKTIPDIDDYPGIYSHLSRFRTIMEARRETKKGSNSWWHLHWPRDEEIWKSKKILSVQMGSRPTFVPTLVPSYVPFSVNVFVPFDSTKENLNYITGILNSRLLWEWYRHHAKSRGVGLEINGHVFAATPIHKIDFSNPTCKKQHNEMVSKVGAMIEANKQLAKAKTDKDKNYYESRCAALDRQIDRLVYDLYDLTEEEIRIVEQS